MFESRRGRHHNLSSPRLCVADPLRCVVEHAARHEMVELVDDIAALALAEHQPCTLKFCHMRRQRILPHAKLPCEIACSHAIALVGKADDGPKPHRVAKCGKSLCDFNMVHISRIIDMNDS